MYVVHNIRGVFVPGGAQYRHERMAAIAKELGKGEYDIVLLQEVRKCGICAVLDRGIQLVQELRTV